MEYLAAIARTGHFGRAAREVGTSQPTISAQLKKVEGWLGFPVFERSRGGVRITPRGERVLESARKVLEEASRISALSDEARAPLEGKFRLGGVQMSESHYKRTLAVLDEQPGVA
jgi:LysR family hydrogen peroxide-inducible transcriptional activator